LKPNPDSLFVARVGEIGEEWGELPVPTRIRLGFVARRARTAADTGNDVPRCRSTSLDHRAVRDHPDERASLPASTRVNGVNNDDSGPLLPEDVLAA
jgi:hypothetical protein